MTSLPDPHFLQGPAGWPRLKALLAGIVAWAGPPAVLAPRRSFFPRAALSRALSLLEAFVRRLLLIEAACAPVLAPARVSAVAKPRQRARRPASTDDPATWRVALNLFPKAPPAYAFMGEGDAARRGAHGRSADGPSCRRLARRLEALLRIAADPKPYAKRLAARLPRVAASARVVLRWPLRHESQALVAPAQREAAHALRRLLEDSS